jgi:hypothetical protein
MQKGEAEIHGVVHELRQRNPATCQVDLGYQTDLRPIAGRIVAENARRHASLEQAAKP